MKKITAILIVDEIEPCVEFWSRVGLEKTLEVPHGDHLGFVILASDSIELMYQSRASVADDMPALATDTYRTSLFVEVESLDQTLEAMQGIPHTVEERTTFYGAREFGVREPAGNLVVFAEFTEKQEPQPN